MTRVLVIGNKNYSSWSLRPWLALAQAGVAFEEKRIALDQAQTKAEILRHSPSGKVPCLIDGPLVVWDSLAICETANERYAGGALWPQDTDARARARSVSAEMHSGFSALRNECSMSCGQRVQLHRSSEALKQDLARIDQLWREGPRLFGGPFLAGSQFTAVDAFFAPVVFRVQSYQLPLSAEAMAYQQRMLDLPSMREWYEAALGETWREVSHEQDIAAYGAIIADYRSR